MHDGNQHAHFFQTVYLTIVILRVPNPHHIKVGSFTTTCSIIRCSWRKACNCKDIPFSSVSFCLSFSTSLPVLCWKVFPREVFQVLDLAFSQSFSDEFHLSSFICFCCCQKGLSAFFSLTNNYNCQHVFIIKTKLR